MVAEHREKDAARRSRRRSQRLSLLASDEPLAPVGVRVKDR